MLIAGCTRFILNPLIRLRTGKFALFELCSIFCRCLIWELGVKILGIIKPVEGEL